MKLIYITNTRLPSEKANSYQSMQMCSSLAKYFDEVELWTGLSKNHKKFRAIKDIFGYYNLKNNFTIKRFFQFDSVILRYLNEFVWANLKNFVFIFNVCLHLSKYRNSNEVIIYTREPYLLIVFQVFKKIKLVDNRIFYESHKFSKYTQKALEKIDGLVVINHYLEKLYKTNYLENILVAHDGVSLEDYSEISNYKFLPNKKEYIILYTGNLFPWKGVYTLVNSIKYLPQNFKLVSIGGSENYLSNFISYVEKNSESNRIKIFSHMQKKYLLEYIEKADVLVLPNSAKDKMSLFTSPIKLFEYMASNRPIIASNLPSITEVLSNNNAFLFEPDNPKDLAEKIQKAVSSNCREVVLKSYEDVKKYTWEKRAQSIAQFISKKT
jgi:glycosyltransferase involved in cell wall biosynthesis